MDTLGLMDVEVFYQGENLLPIEAVPEIHINQPRPEKSTLEKRVDICSL
jgi:hypothetical protein